MSAPERRFGQTRETRRIQTEKVPPPSKTRFCHEDLISVASTRAFKPPLCLSDVVVALNELGRHWNDERPILVRRRTEIWPFPICFVCLAIAADTRCERLQALLHGDIPRHETARYNGRNDAGYVGGCVGDALDNSWERMNRNGITTSFVLPLKRGAISSMLTANSLGVNGLECSLSEHAPA